MHDLSNTDCTQASLCGCTRPERANVALSCVCIALPAPKQQLQSVAWCGLFTLSVGKRTRRCMGCLAQIAHRHRRLGTLPRRLELLPRRTWCIASSQTPKHRMVQPVQPQRRQGDAYRCMTLVAQIAHRHRCVDALGREGESLNILHIAVYVLHCIDSSQTAKRRLVQSAHSLCWQEDTTMLSCLAQIAQRHRHLGALAPKA